MGARSAGETIRSDAAVYRVVGLLGRGATAHTYEAEDEQGRRVAVKELRLESLSTWKALELLEREASALARIRHPRVPEYIEAFALDEAGAVVKSAETVPAAFFIVQTMAPGVSLAAHVASGNRWTAVEAEHALQQLCELLTALHGADPPIIHRDITPKNVVVDASGNVSLVDFGAVQDRIRRDASVQSTSVGTVGYAPMEQWMGMTRPSSDLYALGMTIAFGMTGLEPSKMPFDEKTERVRMADAIPDAPKHLRGALVAMTAPRAQERVASAAAVLQLLQRKSRGLSNSRAKLVAIGAVASVLMSAAASGLVVALEPGSSSAVATPSMGGVAHSDEERWFQSVRARCNPVEVEVMLRSRPAPKTADGSGFKAACYALAGKINEADVELGNVTTGRGRAVWIMFEVIHPVADEGDDRAAGPVMKLVLKYWPENYMAMYHAGMAEYATGEAAPARAHLEKFLRTYHRPDGFTATAKRVLAAMDEKDVHNCDETIAIDPEGRKVKRACPQRL